MKIENAIASVAVRDLKAAKAWYEKLFRADVIAYLKSLGIDTSNASSGAKVKTVMITDPDGNHLAFAETIDPSMAR
jgi:hypothetical protein